MISYNNEMESSITVSESESYKYVRSNSGKQDFIICSVDTSGNKQTKKVSKREFDESVCRLIEYSR